MYRCCDIRGSIRHLDRHNRKKNIFIDIGILTTLSKTVESYLLQKHEKS